MNSNSNRPALHAPPDDPHLDVKPIRRALLSVSNKEGLLDLARALADRGVELLASGGTHAALTEAGLASIEVADYTGQPEFLGGRVKTLHPRIHGGILARRHREEDQADLERHSVAPIDLVVVNLYPFEAALQRLRGGDPTNAPTSSRGELDAGLVEEIDIGGVALIRAAAKNHRDVAVVVDPAAYPSFLHEFAARNGGTSASWRAQAAADAFATTACYDALIAQWFRDQLPLLGPNDPPEHDPRFPQRLTLPLRRRELLRYGENPHQAAAVYESLPPERGPNVVHAQQLHGKGLSYNNLLDADSALRMTLDGPDGRPMAVILKHNNPCGAAIADHVAEAFERAYQGDPVSAFGGIVGLNTVVDLDTAQRMSQPGRFLEVILAPGFTPEAFEWLTTKPTWRNSVRLLITHSNARGTRPEGLAFQRILGGVLVQEWDDLGPEFGPDHLGEVVTQRAPTPEERTQLDFAWRICRMVRSNAIVLVKEGRLVGVGAGQMSRLDSVRIAIEKAGDHAQGAVLASDAFFPFRDGPDLAARAGVTAIIQPGGSKRDDESRAACDEHGMAMIFTRRRHFRH